MTVADSSVVVAAFASWHEHHRPARLALSPGTTVVGHSVLEAYSVLTRLPPPHRAPGDVVRDFLTARFPGPHLFLEPDAHKALVSRLVNLGISGGATYDALIAMTAISAGASLLTRDRRAASTYQRCGAAVRFIP